jgi:hypothetical protein
VRPGRDTVRAAVNPEPGQPQQVLRGFVLPAFLKGRRIRIFTPDAVVLGNQPVVEDIEEIRGGLVPFPPLGNVIDIVRRQRDSTP